MNTRTLLITTAFIGAVCTSQAFGQGRNVEVKTHKITDHVYMLEGAGGNIGLCIGDDGAFMIDDQFNYMTGKIVEAVEKLTDEPIRFLVNTHWHGDHTGGNENMGEIGAIIIAHQNVRERMSTGQFMEAFNREVPAAAAGALPVVTFTEELTLHFNGDDINIFHVDPAHTDGDSIIHFRNANVLHMGDTYFNGMYPFIDTSSNGSIDGMIDAADEALRQSNRETKIIPGHGPLSGVDELRAYRTMLQTVRDRIAVLVAAGGSRDEVVAAKPTASFDEQWGGGFMRPDVFTGIVYDSLTSLSAP